LETNAAALSSKRNAGSGKKLVLDHAAVLYPPYIAYSNKLLDDVRIAVVDVAPDSVLCWATRRVDGPSPYEALLLALVKDPSGTGDGTLGKCLEDDLTEANTFLQGHSSQSLPAHPKYRTADQLGEVPLQSSCVLGPYSFKPAPVRVYLMPTPLYCNMHVHHTGDVPLSQP
jgi:hypothetical protein